MLRVDGVDAYYGLSHVLQNLSLRVDSGEAVALLGRNGAGKTTTFKTIMGVVRARRGRITWQGEDITTLPPHRIVQLGIGYVPEERRIFPNLTVFENLKMARLSVDGGCRVISSACFRSFLRSRSGSRAPAARFRAASSRC
jgi:branched-chain amino acid transport system ATP-binding protein